MNRYNLSLSLLTKLEFMTVQLDILKTQSGSIFLNPSKHPSIILLGGFIMFIDLVPRRAYTSSIALDSKPFI
jgi:hypothetical protein